MERVERDSTVADAAQWLYLNRDAVSPGYLSAQSGANIVEVAKYAKAYDEKASREAPALIRKLAASDSGNHYSETEHFVAEYLLQNGAEILDDDATVFGVTLETVIRLLKDYKAPLFVEAAQ